MSTVRRRPVLAAALKFAHACPCQRCERRWKQPTATMCSCISNFSLTNREVGRKEEEGVEEKKVRKTDGAKGGPCETAACQIRSAVIGL